LARPISIVQDGGQALSHRHSTFYRFNSIQFKPEPELPDCVPGVSKISTSGGIYIERVNEERHLPDG